MKKVLRWMLYTVAGIVILAMFFYISAPFIMKLSMYIWKVSLPSRVVISVEYLPKDIFPDCRENFTGKPCEQNIIIYFREESPLDWRPQCSKFHNELPDFLIVMLTNLKKPRECKPKKIVTAFDEWYRNMKIFVNSIQLRALTSHGPKLLKQYIYGNIENAYDILFLWDEGAIVGYTLVGRLERHKNPQLSTILHMKNSAYSFKISRIPTVNLIIFLNQLPYIIRKFSEDHNDKIENIPLISEGYLENISITPEAQLISIHALEEVKWD